MEKLDYELELKILDACFKTYPSACGVKEFLSKQLNIAQEIIEAEIIYMIESGLLRCNFLDKQPHKTSMPKEVGVFITATGIDYLHNGGLGLKINQCLRKQSFEYQ